MKYPFLYKLAVCFVCISVLLGGCQSSPNANSSNITDVRMTVVPVELDPSDTESFSDTDITFLRIYYGYYSYGRWHDYPSEYYDLKSIFTSKTYTGYDAAGDDHIVKIGPYLVVFIANYTIGQGSKSVPVKITDTLGNEALQIFSEYYSSIYNSLNYGYIKEEKRTNKLFNNESSRTLMNFFGPYYYVILEYDALPENYSLQYTTQENGESVTQVLTYEQIKQLIEGQ